MMRKIAAGRQRERVVDEDDREMQDVDPKPIEDDTARDARPTFGDSNGLDDSGQWARESTLVNGDTGTPTDQEPQEDTEEEDETDDDEQSEEYDEEEDFEGAE